MNILRHPFSLQNFSVKFLLILLFIGNISCSKDASVSQTAPQNEENPNASFTIVTAAITDITQTKATSGGVISGGEGSTVLSRGVVWSTVPNPSISDNFTEDGEGIGAFTSDIINLEAATTYYLRAYISTNNETLYGNETSFNSLEHFIYKGIVILLTQDEVDNFGAMGYTKIEGNLTILGGNEPMINNLNSLMDLIEIQSPLPEFYGLEITTTAVTNLEGLNNLITVKGTVRISSNSELESLAGLNNLKKITGAYYSNNNKIINFTGLNNLESIGRGDPSWKGLVISEAHLINFEGLNSLQTIQGGLEVSNSSNLRDFTGLENLTSIGSWFKVDGLNNTDFSFQGLSSLTTISSFLRVENNQNLMNLTGLESLSSIEGMVIGNNSNLMNLKGLNNLEMNYISITANPLLNNISNLKGTSSFLYWITIDDNDSLQSLEGLNNIPRVESEFEVINNDLLGDFCAVIDVDFFGDYLVYGNLYNPTIQDLNEEDCSI